MVVPHLNPTPSTGHLTSPDPINVLYFRSVSKGVGKATAAGKTDRRGSVESASSVEIDEDPNPGGPATSDSAASSDGPGGTDSAALDGVDMDKDKFVEAVVRIAAGSTKTADLPTACVLRSAAVHGHAVWVCVCLCARMRRCGCL